MVARRTWTVLSAVVIAATASGLAAGPAAAAENDPWTIWVEAQSPGFLVPINTATNTAGTPVSLAVPATTPGIPYTMAVTPDGTSAVVTNADSPPDSYVTVVDLSTGTPTRGPAAGNNLWGTALTPDGSTAYVASLFEATVVQLDAATGAPTGTTFASGDFPAGVALAPDGSALYAVSQRGTVTRFPLPSGTASSVAVGASPQGIAITPDGTHAYVTNNGATTVSVIDLTTFTVSATITVAAQPGVVAVSPDGATVAVGHGAAAAGSLTLIDVATNTVRTNLPTAGSPQGLAFTPDGLRVYASLFRPTQVLPVVVASGTALAPIAITTGSGSLGGLALVPDQAPVAVLAPVTPAQAGSPTSLDASGSTSTGPGTIASWLWDFGDGTPPLTTTTPNTTHTYATAGSFPVTLTVTSSGGTSTTVAFTGQQVQRNGGPSATTTTTVTVAAAPGPTPAPTVAPTSTPTGAPLPAELEATGADTGWGIGLAAVLCAVGTTLVLVARRRSVRA